MIENVYWSSYKVPLIVVRVQRHLNLLDRFSKKYSSTKFHKNPSSGRRVVPCGWTDSHDEADSRISQFFRKLLRMYSCDEDNLTGTSTFRVS